MLEQDLVNTNNSNESYVTLPFLKLIVFDHLEGLITYTNRSTLKTFNLYNFNSVWAKYLTILKPILHEEENKFV